MFNNHHNGYARYRPPQQPAMQSETLKSAEIDVDRKFFTFALKENIRGKFLSITENRARQRDTIVIPQSGLADFARVFAEMVKAESELQPPPNLES